MAREVKLTESWRYTKMLFILLAKDLKLEIRSKEIVPLHVCVWSYGHTCFCFIIFK